MNELVDTTRRLALATPNATQHSVDIAVSSVTSPIMLVIGLTDTFGFLLGLAIIIFFMSFVYWALVQLFRSKMKYSQAVAIYSISYLPVSIGAIIITIYQVITKTPILTSGAVSYSNTIINQFNIFYLWQLVLIFFGISTVTRLSKRKSVLIVLIVFATGLLIALFFAAISILMQSIYSAK